MILANDLGFLSMLVNVQCSRSGSCHVSEFLYVFRGRIVFFPALFLQLTHNHEVATARDQRGD